MFAISSTTRSVGWKSRRSRPAAFAREISSSNAVSGITPLGGDEVEIQGTLTARGHQEPLTFAAAVTEATADAVTIKAKLPVDGSRFGMTWSPVRTATMHTRITVTARFLRA